MGATYWNITVRTTDVALVSRVLADHGVDAWVTRPVDGSLVVFDDAGHYGPEGSFALATALSVQCRCAVMQTYVEESDVLSLWLYRDGATVAWYTAHSFDDPPPAGDPEAFRTAFAPSAPAAAVRTAFLGAGEDVIVEDRHSRIVDALGVPGAAVGNTWEDAPLLGLELTHVAAPESARATSPPPWRPPAALPAGRGAGTSPAAGLLALAVTALSAWIAAARLLRRR